MNTQPELIGPAVETAVSGFDPEKARAVWEKLFETISSHLIGSKYFFVAYSDTDDSDPDNDCDRMHIDIFSSKKEYSRGNRLASLSLKRKGNGPIGVFQEGVDEEVGTIALRPEDINALLEQVLEAADEASGRNINSIQNKVIELYSGYLKEIEDKIIK
ncbi:hypothetical protein KJ951_03470 [Patescibacteria group bacterium]|nr:hypothetical protein [Patescibacteria group bacterium]MBU1703438.1 hypothetical protein [Patescibacteria group bacterium]MBU1954011.1 hypothetical protein [Patescibacteria group bacterium]